MSQTRIDISGELLGRIHEAVLYWCHIYKITVFEMCNPRRRTPIAVLARGDLIEWLYTNLVVHRRTKEVRLKENGTLHVDKSWGPPSLPVIGYIMQQDHSTILIARTRWNKRRRQQEAEAAANETRRSTH